MGVFYILFLGIVGSSVLAGKINLVVRVSYNNSLYYGYGKYGVERVLIDCIGNDEKVKLYRESPTNEDMDKMLQQEKFSNPGHYDCNPLDFVDVGVVEQTETFDAQSVSYWFLYYTNGFNYSAKLGLYITRPAATPIVFLIVTMEGKQFPEIKATLYTPEDKKSMLLEYSNGAALEVNKNELADLKPKYLVFVRHDPDSQSLGWHRMTVWYTHVGPRLVGNFFSKEVLFWIQPTGSEIRYVLPAIIDEFERTISIAPGASATVFDTKARSLEPAPTTNWGEKLRERTEGDYFGINRQAKDFNRQLMKTIRNENYEQSEPESFAETSWSKISVRDASVDSLRNASLQSWYAWLKSNDVTVFFKDIALPA